MRATITRERQDGCHERESDPRISGATLIYAFIADRAPPTVSDPRRKCDASNNDPLRQHTSSLSRPPAGRILLRGEAPRPHTCRLFKSQQTVLLMYPVSRRQLTSTQAASYNPALPVGDLDQQKDDAEIDQSWAAKPSPSLLYRLELGSESHWCRWSPEEAGAMRVDK